MKAIILGLMMVLAQSQAQNLRFPQFMRISALEKLKNLQIPYDGRGNNIENPNWGATDIQLIRYCPVNYADGISQPRVDLPLPREISNIVGAQKGDFKRSRSKLTILYTFWAQFLDHDISLSVQQEDQNKEVFPIIIPPNDPHLSKPTMPFVRINYDKKNTDQKKPRIGINTLSAYLDGTMVYGVNQKRAIFLRQFKGGRLRQSEDGLLPRTGKAFDAGESRTNENIALTCIHTLLNREHNRLCGQIEKLNPKLNDEQIYQIARTYVIALIQKITFDDFLPILLGSTVYQSTIGRYRGYNPNIRPDVPTQFTTAAFRIGHPILIDKFPQINEKGETFDNLKLTGMFSRPDLMSNDRMNWMFRGLTQTHLKQKSCRLIDDVRNLLILDGIQEVKLDLFSLNVQRHRDNGIADFNSCRKSLGFKPISSFQELTRNEDQVEDLKEAYKNRVDDLDLWVATICEKPSNNGIMGQSTGTLVGRVFKNIRDGDRFFYQRVLPWEILMQIKQTEIGDLIRRNTDVKNVRSNAFYYV